MIFSSEMEIAFKYLREKDPQVLETIPTDRIAEVLEFISCQESQEKVDITSHPVFQYKEDDNLLLNQFLSVPESDLSSFKELSGKLESKLESMGEKLQYKSKIIDSDSESLTEAIGEIRLNMEDLAVKKEKIRRRGWESDDVRMPKLERVDLDEFIQEFQQLKEINVTNVYSSLSNSEFWPSSVGLSVQKGRKKKLRRKSKSRNILSKELYGSGKEEILNTIEDGASQVLQRLISSESLEKDLYETSREHVVESDLQATSAVEILEEDMKDILVKDVCSMIDEDFQEIHSRQELDAISKKPEEASTICGMKEDEVSVVEVLQLSVDLPIASSSESILGYPNYGFAVDLQEIHARQSDKIQNSHLVEVFDEEESAQEFTEMVPNDKSSTSLIEKETKNKSIDQKGHKREISLDISEKGNVHQLICIGDERLIDSQRYRNLKKPDPNEKYLLEHTSKTKTTGGKRKKAKERQKKTRTSPKITATIIKQAPSPTLQSNTFTNNVLSYKLSNVILPDSTLSEMIRVAPSENDFPISEYEWEFFPDSPSPESFYHHEDICYTEILTDVAVQVTPVSELSLDNQKGEDVDSQETYSDSTQTQCAHELNNHPNQKAVYSSTFVSTALHPLEYEKHGLTHQPPPGYTYVHTLGYIPSSPAPFPVYILVPLSELDREIQKNFSCDNFDVCEAEKFLHNRWNSAQGNLALIREQDLGLITPKDLAWISFYSFQ